MKIGNHATIGHHAIIGNGAAIGDGTTIGNCITISNTTAIEAGDRFINIGPLGSGNRTLVVILRNGKFIYQTGCFKGSHNNFVKAVTKKHGDNPIAAGYLAAVEYAEKHLRRQAKMDGVIR